MWTRVLISVHPVEHIILKSLFNSIHRSLPRHQLRPLCVNSYTYKKLLGAPGLTTRNKKLLGAKGIATRSNNATNGAPHIATNGAFLLLETNAGGPRNASPQAPPFSGRWLEKPGSITQRLSRCGGWRFLAAPNLERGQGL